MNIITKMKRIQWKSRKTFILLAIFLIAILLLRIKYYSYSSVVELKKAKAAVVWEYVADFSNLKKLNPSITDFIILNDSGNFDTWRYTVEYKEVSNNWPYLTSETLGNYEVKNVHQPVQSYFITSNHTSCTVFGSICLTTYSNYEFIQKEKFVSVVEVINYQCPVIFSGLCRKEIEFQRAAIARNLLKYFH